MTDLEKYRASELEKLRTADLLRIVPKGRSTVLDIGTRDGHFSRLLTNHFSSVTALDLVKPTFDYPGIVTVAGDITNLDFPDNSFDCIFCTEVLEHIPNVTKACQEIIRVARHEIVIGVPFRQDTRISRATCNACGKISPPWGHVNSFDEQRLINLFHGLKLVSKSFVGTSNDATNPLAALLMDLAGNPYGTYAQDLQCVHCGSTLLPPQPNRSLTSRVFAALAIRLTHLQTRFTPSHGNWIHLVFSKTHTN
jgi:SAM-dependent methyltransferase